MAAGMIGERWRWVTIGFLGLCLLIGLVKKVLADEPSIWSGINALAGQFEQRITDANGKPVSTSEGEFSVLKPHYLRWFVRAPGQQLLLSDGAFLWQYDLDLETVTRQRVDHSRQSPLRLLIEAEDLLQQDYHITHDGNAMTLVPRAEQPLFQSVTVRFDGGQPRQMHLLDNLGQSIEIDLRIDTNATPTPEDFQFDLESLPEGVEISGLEG